MRIIRTAAKALIIRDDRLLTIQLTDSQGTLYALPGGGQEPGEALNETVKRECLEEISAAVDVGKLLFVAECIGGYNEFAGMPRDVHSVEFVFVCYLQPGTEPRNGDTVDDGQVRVAWLALDKLDSYRLYPLELRPFITRLAAGDAPVYLGNIK